MDATHFESYLLGRLAALEAELKASLPVSPPAADPDPPPSPPTPAELNQHFLDNLESIAGVKPSPAVTTPPPPPPATLNRASATYARDFAKYAEAIATGQTQIIEETA